MKTLTETIEFLEEAIANVRHDISSDWILKVDEEKMRIQLNHLITAKVHLDAIKNDGKESQIFSSSISF